MSRFIIIALCVVTFHVAALWMLQAGLMHRSVEVFVPAEILIELIEPPSPQVARPAAAPHPIKQTIFKAAPTAQTSAIQPLAISDPIPTPDKRVGDTVSKSVSQPLAAPAAATPMPIRVEQPSSDADYLNNPKPRYPALSKRLGEQGKVVVHVLIGVDGTAKMAEIKQSSSFNRLDQAAISTVLTWRFVPGKRAGVPEAMWFNVPINFVLE